MLRRIVKHRAALALALGLAFASCALPQETSSKEGQAGQAEPGIWWKWANFAILAAGLGYLIRKNVPPLFHKQSEAIQSALAESAKIKQDAAAYAAAVEARLGSLQREIQQLRESAHAEMTAESERIRRETEHHVQKVREQSVQEIALMTRAAKDNLRKYAAELAIGLADRHIRFRMSPEIQTQLVDGFLHDLDRASGQNSAAN